MVGYNCLATSVRTLFSLCNENKENATVWASVILEIISEPLQIAINDEYSNVFCEYIINNSIHAMGVHRVLMQLRRLKSALSLRSGRDEACSWEEKRLRAG